MNGEDEIPNFDFQFMPFEREGEQGDKAITEPQEKRMRFPEIGRAEISDILQQAQSKNTKYSTKWAVSIIEEWRKERYITKILPDMNDKELDETLQLFYVEARNKNGETYSRSTLISLRYAVERYLNNPPYEGGIKIAKNPAFTNSNRVLDAQLKIMKQQGKENTKHKPAIEQDNLKKLKTSPAILPCTPLGLLRNVWFHTTLYWCKRGREGQRKLTRKSFEFCSDATGRQFARMSHDEASKNHPGGVVDTVSFEKLARMYQTSHPTDGFSALQLYIQKLNPKCEAFFQYPKRNWQPDDVIWFEDRPLGVNKLATMMKELSSAAALSQVYTNHCVRATAITLWSEAGLPDRQIMAISGHRNESSLKSYHSRPSSSQLRQCSDVLSLALDGNRQLEQTRQQFPLQIQGSSTQTQSSVNLNGMFSGCSIENVQINFNQQ